MALTAAFKTKAFHLKSACGREYHVPVSGVARDYADYLVTEDKLTLAAAEAQMTDTDVHSWFAEQFNWADVERCGVLVKNASAEDVARALNLMREESDPASAALAKLIKA